MRKVKENYNIMGTIMILSLLLFISLPQMSICAVFDLSGKPTRAPEPAEPNPLDILAKQKKEDIITTSGRSSGSETVYQGDIVLNKDEILALGVGGRTANKNIAVLLWPRKLWRTRVVPYEITGHGSANVRKIKDALRDLEKRVCLRFRRRTSSDKAWLRIFRGSSCWANIGRSLGFGRTDVSIGYGCLSQTLIQHEIIHALGFFHEQSRRDRNNYVKILRWNISPQNLFNFDKTDVYQYETFGVPYDYKSIMHYTRTSWTKNGQNTMEAKNDPNLDLGGTVLSKYDVMKLNLMYHCHESAGAIWTEWSDWSRCLTTNYGCRRSKHRICLVENLAQCDGADDWGVQSNSQECETRRCSVEPNDGFWGSWSKWSSCSRDCDRGTRTRSRSCDSPRPTNGGKTCKGPSTDTERCMKRSCRKNKYFTNFDTGLGIWSNVQGYKDPLDWKRGYGRSSTSSGPESDHTTGNGYYLYVSSASYTSNKKKATLVSEQLSGPKCLSFAYCMNGKNMGKIDLAYKPTVGQWRILPFLKKGHQGKGWHHAEINLNERRYPYRIFFETELGFSPHSDIALDDILIENGLCRSEVKKPTAGKPKPTPKQPVVVDGCNDKNSPQCKRRANRGECYWNKKVMLKECCLACRSMGDCKKDTHSKEHCPDWASKGECNKNPAFMWKKCCKSCKELKKCTGDKESKCKGWAEEGFCNHKDFKTYMLENCCSSCLKGKGEKTCVVDKSDNCKDWAKEGECHRNRAGMKYHCCKTCKEWWKQCTKDKFDTSKCKQWAASGECKKNKIWMYGNCCKSCTAPKECTDKHRYCKIWVKDGLCKTQEHIRKLCCSMCAKAAQCTDKHRYCKIWVKDGLCKTQENIRKLCCSMCAKAAECTDKHRYCKIWVKDGLCKQEKIRKLCCSMCSKV